MINDSIWRLLATLIAPVAMALTGVAYALPNVPSEGRLTLESPTLSFTGGEVLIPNPLSVCIANLVDCDEFTLQVELPEDFSETNPGSTITVSLAADIDYDFTVTDENGADVAVAFSGNTPEVASFPIGSGRSTFTIGSTLYLDVPNGYETTVTLNVRNDPPATEAPSGSSVLGAGDAVFENLTVPMISSAPEPTIGISWKTDHVFYHAGSTTIRYAPDAEGDDVWVDVTPPYQVPTNLDPMLIVHEETGRMLAGGLLGACSVMMVSDNDGETWLPAANMCSGAQFDHQSVGLGVKPGATGVMGSASDLNGYYCGQLGEIGCSVSVDGGVTWTPPSPHIGSCGGFHGHWRVSNVTGTAMLPVGRCGEQQGFIVPTVLSELGGVTGLLFDERLVEGSHTWTGGFDPSIGISRDSGTVYYGMADRMGARVAISEDEGKSWEKIGPNADTTWLDVGQFHEPPILAATFADVQAGDDDRAAFAFLGIEATGDRRIDVQLQSDAIFDCNDKPGLLQSDLVWNYYIAFTFDRGQSWEVKKISDDPVQIGGVWDGGGGEPCRNLLDFNDMDIDSTGRVYIAYADGCTGDCAAAANPADAIGQNGHFDRAPRMFRQIGGKSLFARYDIKAASEPAAETAARATTETKGGLLDWLALSALLGALIRRRRA